MSMADDYDMDPPDSFQMSADDMLSDLDDCGRLNDWALEFVDSMLNRREQDEAWHKRLSAKQLSALRSLWERYCNA